MAHTLVNAGKSVLDAREGPAVPAAVAVDPIGLSDFKRDELYLRRPEKHPDGPGHGEHRRVVLHQPRRAGPQRRAARLPRHRQRATTRRSKAIPRQCVGGGTQLYGGVSLRFSPPTSGCQSFNAGRTDLQRRPQRRRRSARRATGRSPTTTWSRTTPRPSSWSASTARARTRRSRPAADYYQTPLPPNPISEYAARRHGRARHEAATARRWRSSPQDHAPSGRTVGRPTRRRRPRPRSSTATAIRSG